MTVWWRTCLNIVCWSVCSTGVAMAAFQVRPQNVTQLLGSDVQFNATVEGPWKIMTWEMKHLLVLTVSIDGLISSSSDHYSASFCSISKSCVQFTIHQVQRNDSGHVVCTIQGLSGSKTAQLNVQESGTISIPGGNVTAQEDEQVQFQCQTSGWFPMPTISWTLNGYHANSSLVNTSSLVWGDAFNSSSVLKFQAVRNTTVTCLASVTMATESSSVYLVVVPKPPDWTVLIAVVVSFSAAALLVLLIIGIVFCYKRRKEKESNYQDEMSRRVRTQSQLSTSAAEARQGHANAAYVMDPPTDAAAAQHKHSGSFQTSGSNMVDIFVIGKNNWNENDSNKESGFVKHRHVTIV